MKTSQLGTDKAEKVIARTEEFCKNSTNEELLQEMLEDWAGHEIAQICYNMVYSELKSRLIKCGFLES